MMVRAPKQYRWDWCTLVSVDDVFQNSISVLLLFVVFVLGCFVYILGVLSRFLFLW